MKEPDEIGGLRLARNRYGWQVIHQASDVAISPGRVRLRVYAEEMRAGFLATGVDFTRASREVAADREAWRAVYALWRARCGQDFHDFETGEYYSTDTHFGRAPQSLAAAAHYRRALAWARELAEACQDDQSRAQVTEVIRSASEGGEIPPWKHRTPLMQWVCEALQGEASPWEVGVPA